MVIRADNLRKYYELGANALFGGATRVIKANESVSFEAREAETLAIVGEFGCGKSTLAKVLLGLETASGGTVTLGNQELGQRPIERRDTATVAQMQMVFQNPFDTLNPSHSVGNQIVRVLEKFRVGRTQAERRARMQELLDLVRLPRAFADRMPRQLSGGQKQRIGIARAFAGTPKVVVADEPVSALDVSVQAAVTDLLMDLQRTRRTTMLFISHDLGVVQYLADRVMVMYLGHVVEIGTTAQVFGPPYHPYTEALLSAAPSPTPRSRRSASCSRRRPLGDAPAPRLPVPDPLPPQGPGPRHPLRDRGAPHARARPRPPRQVPPLRVHPPRHGARRPHRDRAGGLSRTASRVRDFEHLSTTSPPFRRGPGQRH